MERIISLFFVIAFTLIAITALFGAIKHARIDLAFYFVMSAWFAYFTADGLIEELKEEKEAKNV